MKITWQLIVSIIVGPIIGVSVGCFILILSTPEGFGWLGEPISLFDVITQYFKVFGSSTYAGMMISVPIYLVLKKSCYKIVLLYLIGAIPATIFGTFVTYTGLRLLQGNSVLLNWSGLFPYGFFHPIICTTISFIIFLWLICSLSKSNQA